MGNFNWHQFWQGIGGQRQDAWRAKTIATLYAAVCDTKQAFDQLVTCEEANIEALEVYKHSHQMLANCFLRTRKHLAQSDAGFVDPLLKLMTKQVETFTPGNARTISDDSCPVCILDIEGTKALLSATLNKLDAGFEQLPRRIDTRIGLRAIIYPQLQEKLRKFIGR